MKWGARRTAEAERSWPPWDRHVESSDGTLWTNAKGHPSCSRRASALHIPSGRWKGNLALEWRRDGGGSLEAGREARGAEQPSRGEMQKAWVWEVALKKQERGLDQGLAPPGLPGTSGMDRRDGLWWQWTVLAPRWYCILETKKYRKTRTLEQGRQPVSSGHWRAPKEVYIPLTSR